MKMFSVSVVMAICFFAGCQGLVATKSAQNLTRQYPGDEELYVEPTAGLRMVRFPPGNDCWWGRWGDWSSCSIFDGLGSRSRSRRVLTPATFEGMRCSGSMYEVNYECHGNASSDEESDTLACSDPINLLCEDRPALPNIAITAAGYDIIKDTSVGFVLDNGNFCGECDTVYLGEFDKNFRRPYNVQSFRPSTDVHTTLHINSYEDTKKLTEAKNKEFESKFSGEISYAYANIFSFSASAARTEERKWRSVIGSSTSRDSMYFTVTCRVEIGQFQMNRNYLELSSQFRERIAQLPTNYDYAKYFEFLSDFGTHYYTRGKLGGTFDIIFEHSREKVEETGLTEVEQANCLKMEISFAVFGFGSSQYSSGCSYRGSSSSQSESFTESATWSDAEVRGGSPSSAVLLTISGAKTNAREYQTWAESVKYNPVIIDFELAPISNLVRSRLKKLNVERALAELFGAYDPNNCRRYPGCRNGGRFVVTDRGKRCICVCPSGYYGHACEKQWSA